VRLYDYFRSSAAYRVRIALNLKGIAPDERTYVHLRMGSQRAQDYLALNPQGLVPALALDDGSVLTQSLAIIEYLDETHPRPPLLPREPAARARVRAIALSIACEIHPLDNLRVLNYLIGTMGVSREQKDGWYRYWIDVGFEALEKRLARESATGRFCHDDAPTLADVFLVPQMANARRFEIDLSPYPTLLRIESACNALPAFAQAAPARQPDAE
jgi:maleylacetoacetate isomerase